MQDYSHFRTVKEKLEKRNKELKELLVEKHKDAFEWLNTTKQIAAGAMGSILLLTSPGAHLLSAHTNIQNQQFADISDNVFMVSDLFPNLPQDVGELSSVQEDKIAEVLSSNYGINVKPEINGLRLNTTYGYIGLEQNLMRYPGDVVPNMAPGRGAFGYFANSKSEMTQKDIEREKYYIAVQTFMAKDYNGRLREYRDFFKFRKMLVVNPSNGHAVVAVIGDAGPALWTEKSLGGSPEVMSLLERVDGRARGGVLYFFIDDPEDRVPLGPIEPA